MLPHVWIELILGLLFGACLGITGIAPTGMLLLVLDTLGIGAYKTNLGTILFLHMMPLSIGSVYEFWNVKKINWSMAGILLLGCFIGSFFSSAWVVNKRTNNLDVKTIKYITACISLFVSIAFFHSAYNHK